MTCIVCGGNAHAKVIIFPRMGGTIPVILCYGHERELFLQGQEKFVMRHMEKLKSSESREARELINGFKQLPIKIVSSN